MEQSTTIDVDEVICVYAQVDGDDSNIDLLVEVQKIDMTTATPWFFGRCISCRGQTAALFIYAYAV